MEPLQPGDPASIGPYRLEGRLGAGGMGLVYAARSPGGRRVAVKVVRAEYAADPGFRQRFAREVEAARRVGGFHTAQIVAADPEAALPWMATAYIDGPSLLDLVRAAGPLPAERCIKLARELAEGLAAIHECDLVHRDLKPGNLLMAADGVRIIDFGIARAPGESPLTATGTAIGTFAYMSPEQVAAREVGPAGDVFSLGAVLTFAATGHGPFDADSIPGIAHRIATAVPDLGKVRGPLRRVIEACLAKAPEDRPAAAAVLTLIDEAEAPEAEPDEAEPDAETEAEPDAEAETESDPISAPPTVIAPDAPDAPAVATADPSMPATATDSSSRDPLERVPDNPGRRGRRALIAIATCLAVGAAVAVPTLLSKNPSNNAYAPPPTPSPTLLQTLNPPGYTAVDSVAFAPDGATVATGDFDGNTYLWNARTGSLTATLAGPRSANGAAPVASIAYAPNGTTLAAGDGDGHTYLWNTVTRKITATLTNPATPAFGVASVAFAPNGTTLATTDSVHLYLWNTATGKLTATLDDPNGYSAYVNTLTFSPKGTTLAGADGASNIYLWDTATGKLVSTLNDPTGAAVDSMAFAPNGTTLATVDSNGNGTGGGDIDLWDTATGKLTATFVDPTGKNLNAVAFAPNGASLLTGEGTEDDVFSYAYSWNTKTGKTTATYGCFDDEPVNAVAFSPNGATLALGCWSGQTMLYRTADTT